MRIVFASALLAAAVTCIAAPKATAQERAMARVDSGLARLKRALGPGYSEAQQQQTRQFSRAFLMNYDWTASRGSYVILAAGEDKVTGITMRVYGAGNVIVAADTSGSTTTRINLTVAEHGTPYRLEFTPTCSQFPCFMGLQIMQRR
jgi:hypothetical protein